MFSASIKNTNSGNGMKRGSVTLLLLILFTVFLAHGPQEKFHSAALAASLGSCSGCHGNPPVDGTRDGGTGQFLGSHTKHTTTYSMACSKCHYLYTNNSTNYKHQNKFINITGSEVKGNSYNSAGWDSVKHRKPVTNTPSFGACNSVYCHGSGRLDKPQYIASPTWGSATLNCLSCHGGRASASGAYTYSAGTFRLSTTHSQHLKYPAANMNCQICHSKTATDAASLNNYSGTNVKHVNKVKDVTFTSITYGSYSSYKSTAMGSSSNSNKCGNVSCHGGTTRSAWSKTFINNDNTCVHCHGTAGTLASVPNSGDNRKFFAPGWNSTGTDTDGVSSRQDYQVGAHFKHLSSVLMKKIKCNECHIVPSTPFDGTTHMAQPRFTVSQTLAFDQASSAKFNGPNSTTLVVFTGYTSGKANKAATCSSVYCHGNRLKNLDTAGTFKKPYWNFSGMTNSSSDKNAITCARCHGTPPSSVSGNHSGKVFPANCDDCHGSVVDATGKIINKALHINGVVNASGCTSCHGNPPTTLANMAAPATNALGGVAFGAHSSHVKFKQMTCAVCHNNSSGSMPSNIIEMGFAVSAANWPTRFTGTTPVTYGSYTGRPGLTGYTWASSSAGTTVVTAASGTRNSCSIYCHGGWTGSGKTNPSWTDGAAAKACGKCHLATVAAPPASSSHPKHVGAYKNTCTTCHPSRDGGIEHTEGSVQWKFSTSMPRVGASAKYTRSGATGTGTATGSTNYLAGSTPYGSCGGIYCHSSGRTDVTQYNNPTWGGTTNCLSCHGGRNSASGTYTFSASGFRLSTTHSQHLKYPAANINCQICHSKTATDAAVLNNYSAKYIKHGNAVKDVTFTSITYGSYSSYKSTAMGSGSNSNKCGNISCHGGTTRSAWSKTAINNDNTCVHCHGTAGTLASVPNSGDNRKFFAPGWNTTGIDTDGDSSRQNFQVGAHFKHLSSVFMKKIKCNECHIVPSSPFDGTTHMAQPRFTASQTLSFDQASSAKYNGPNSTTLAVFTGYTSGSAAKAATCSSVYCHGNRLKNGDTAGSYRKPMWTYSGMTKNSSDQYGVSCGRCHGNPPGAPALHSGKTATTSCSGCHGDTVNATGKIINKGKHINGQVESPGADCGACHAATQNTGQSTYTRRIITGAGGDFVRLSRHVSNGSATEIVTKWDCTICHMEGDTGTGGTGPYHHGASDPSGLINLRNVDTPTTGWAINNRAMTEPMRADLDTFCMTCHDTDGAKGINVNATNSGFNMTTTRALTPFNTADNLMNGRDITTGRTRVLDVKTQFYAGTGTGAAYNGNPSQHAVLGKRYWTNNAGWTSAGWNTSHTYRNSTQASTVRETATLHCSDCHLSETNAHGAANAWHMLLNGVANDYTSDTVMSAVTVTSTATICYKCHAQAQYDGVSNSTVSRNNHNAQGDNRPLAGAYGATGYSRLGATCGVCHAGGGWGNIHGVSGTYTAAGGTLTKYRFFPGSVLGIGNSSGTSTDADLTSTATTSCYGLGSASNWTSCNSHTSPGTALTTFTLPPYTRGVKY